MVEENDKQNLESEPVQEADSLLEQTKKTIDELKEQNDRKEALIVREEKLKATQMLGGKAEAGTVPVKPEEESAEDYAKKVMANDI